MHKTVRAHLALPAEYIVFCGISLGYADLSQPINSLVTERASFEEIAEMRGFTEGARGAEEILAV
jgi:hypothetical protein